MMVIDPNIQRLHTVRAMWDEAAATFDNDPDHSLFDPQVRDAWTNLLRSMTPPQKSTILDIGCGTGSLSLVLAELGHKVIGVDLSSGMLTIAEQKAQNAGHEIEFEVMDAAFPQFESQKFDVIICRHLLWTISEPAQVLQRWVTFLNPQGQLILIEGFWHTGAGLYAEDIRHMLPSEMQDIGVQNLSTQTDLWGGIVTDERYVISARLGL